MAEEIVAKLQQVDVLNSQGGSIADAILQIGVSEVASYRWRQEDGGPKSKQVKRLKELEKDRAVEASLVQAQWRGPGCARRCRTSRWTS